MILTVVLFMVSLSLSQVVGNSTSIFLVNANKFTIEILLSLCIIYTGKYCYRVAKSDIRKFVLVAIFNYMEMTLLYVSATLLPVGNTSGLYMGFWITFTTAVDVLRKKVSKLTIITATVAILGIILLTQPWHFSPNMADTPCEYIDKYIDSNYSVNSLSANSSFFANSSNSTKLSDGGSKSLLMGYIFIVIATVSSTIADNISKSLYSNYSVFCVLLWVGLIQLLLTLFVLAGLGYFQPSSLLFPDGHACLGFTIGFIITMTMDHLMLNITFVYFTVSMVALVMVFTTIGLYVVQRTLLKKFHSGNANSMEVLGIICILVTPIISTLISHYFVISL